MLISSPDKSDDEVAPASAAPVAKKPVGRSKWEGEDEDDSAPAVRETCHKNAWYIAVY